MKPTLLLFFSLISLAGLAQPETDLFPDFTETDINGVDHTLYDYLSDGKTVVIDIFATWCPICVNSLPGLHELEAEYGDDLVFLSFERDPDTSNENTWAMEYNVTNAIFANSQETMASWNTIYQPNFFVICPDGTFELKVGGIGSSSSPLDDFVAVCLDVQTNDITESLRLDFTILHNPVNTHLNIQSSLTSAEFEIYGLTGELYLKGTLENHLEVIDVSALSQGFYFVKVHDNNLEVVKKFIKE